MITLEPIVRADITANFITDVARREVAIWIRDGTLEDEHAEALADLIRLPWRMVLLETSNSKLVTSLSQEDRDDLLVRKRGYIQIVDGNPSQITLPQQCLPVYLLNGSPKAPTDPFQARLRRMTMLNELYKSAVRGLFVLSPKQGNALPDELSDLHTAGFRSYITITSNNPDAESIIRNNKDTNLPITILSNPIIEVIDQIIALFRKNHAFKAQTVRLRCNEKGDFSTLDISNIDDPERPILSRFKVIQESDLSPLLPDEISQESFINFFREPTLSWEPYAAGLPWDRHSNAKEKMVDLLRRVEVEGPDQSKFATVISESGSGGTTFVYDIAWHCATQGYPVLVAHQLPFVPDSLAMSNFLNRVRQLVGSNANDAKHYEVPWLIIFDRLHWEHGGAELRGFFRDIRRHGRPICVLTVTGPRRGRFIFDSYPEHELANLTNAISQEDARTLGTHLNKFLKVHGRVRQQHDWDRFHEQHRVGVDFSMFWIALSFWIRGRYDLTETIQERIFRTFKNRVTDPDLQHAILDIAALSAERIPTPEQVLVTPKEKDWPVPRLLEDIQPDISDLGLFQFKITEQRYWTLVHDILGEQLLNALFYDADLLSKLGFEDAQEPIALRLIILRRIAEREEVGQAMLKELGEKFATSIFKIDPDHGHAVFAHYWRDVVWTLDKMDQSLKNSSRIFRHHTAISRRRIAKLENQIYEVSATDQQKLLSRAIDDVEFAIESIRYEPGDETDLNLYNTLAHAYFDLADLLAGQSMPAHEVNLLREKGNDASRRVFEDDPTNSFAIETYVRNLLGRSQLERGKSVEYAIEALGILFSALMSSEKAYRMTKLEGLSDKAVEILFSSKRKGSDLEHNDPKSPIDVLKNAWTILTAGSDQGGGAAFEDVSEPKRHRALKALDHKAGRGNVQVVKLTYELTSITYPHDFSRQLELVQALQGSGRSVSPQLRLEFAILLYQVGRAVEGNDVFFELRRLWRERDYVVEVPHRLHWLRDKEGMVKTVGASVAPSESGRPMAEVREFQRRRAPFRPEEFGVRNPKVGMQFRCRVTFGHNGPLLRPIMAVPSRR